MLDSVSNVDSKRKQRIIEVLDINPNWRMHQVSDGQRRRVQLAYGLLTEYAVLLLDEITVDLDVLGRGDLMAFLRQECETRQVTIVYATHIFDGLEQFATHVAFVAGGELRFCTPMEELDGLATREPGKYFPITKLRLPDCPYETDTLFFISSGALLTTVEGWLRKEAEIKKQALAARGIVKKKVFEYQRNSGWGEGRMGSTLAQGPELKVGMAAGHTGIKGSSNAVMRG